MVLKPMAPEPARGAYAVVALLAVVYTLNFMDRQILSILQEPIRREMKLSDTDLGILTGLAFALFYTGFGIPIAWACDRYRRVPIIALACSLWSLFTVACGLAQNYAQLATARLLVGMGEAGGSPPSYSLISDYFPRERRATALALYSLGVPIGSALGIAFGGWVVAHYGWRIAFVSVGLPGIVLGAIVLLTIREPSRGRLDIGADNPEHGAARPIWVEFASFFRNRTLVLLSLSSGLSAFVGYAMLSWNPSMLERTKGMSITEVAMWYSLVLGGTGVIGTFAAGWLADRLGLRDVRWYGWLPALGFLLTLPAVVGIVMADHWSMALLFVAVPAMLNTSYLAPALATVQNAIPPARRAMTSAILLFVLNLIGVGGGPLFVGRVSDLAKARWGEQSLLIGYAALVPVIILTVFAHLAVARAIGRDARRSATITAAAIG